jgi:predicted ArsR family transcriptional regulator
MAPPPRWEERFFGTTRGQIIVLLRRTRDTVDGLAHRLGLTDNAVRSHLATLERDGIVVQRGVQRGAGKPSNVYELAPDAERLFPKAYGLILRELLDVLEERMTPKQLEDLLRDVGRRLGARQRGGPDPIETAVDALNALGGLAEARWPEATTNVIHGFACPLAEVLPQHPLMCRLAEAMLAEATGLEVIERCDRGGERPQCRFETTLR